MLLYHCGVPWLGGGFLGVDLFFVLSGFLVTSVLLAEAAARGRISVLAFYARRVRRLLPAAVLVIVATCGLQLLVASLPQRVGMVDDARAALLYVANWQFIVDSRDYFAATTDRSPFVHFWSLSIEEQFYVALPLLLWLVWRRSADPVRTLAIGAAAVTAVSLGLQVWRAQDDITYAYYATDTRVYQLAAGVLLACLLHRRSTPYTARGAGTALTVAGLAGLLALASLADGLSASWRGIGAAAASVAILAGLSAASGGPVARVLALEPVRYLGTISYSTYLWHWPVVLLLEAVLDVGPLATAVGVAVAATALAALSDRLLERPIRTSRPLAARPRLVLATGLAVSVLVALVLVRPVLSDPRRPAVVASGTASDGGAAAALSPVLDRPVPPGLDLVGALADVPDAGGICTADDLDACRLVEGDPGDPDGLGVVLVGDSHAQMFVDAFEALAEERGWTLHASVLKACTWQQGMQNELSSPEAQALCRTAREEFYADVLPRLDADVVVAITLPRSDREWEERLTAEPAPPGETLVERQLRTSRDTTEAITATGVPLVLVKSVFGTGGYGRKGPDPLDCLARAATLAECAVVPPLTRPAADSIYETLATESDLVSVVDLVPDICLTPPLCQPVRGRTVIWKDPDHITGRFATEQRGRFLARLQRAAPDVAW